MRSIFHDHIDRELPYVSKCWEEGDVTFHRDVLYRCIDALFAGGYSGGSMMLVANVISGLKFTVTEQELPGLEAVRQILRESGDDAQKHLVSTIYLMPWSALTGSDEEWAEPFDDSGRMVRQNKRAAAVFQDVETSKAWWLDKHFNVIPDRNGNWIQRAAPREQCQITFPVNPSDWTSTHDYWYDCQRVGTTPALARSYMAIRENKASQGIDPDTNALLNEFLFDTSSEGWAPDYLFEDIRATIEAQQTPINGDCAGDEHIVNSTRRIQTMLYGLPTIAAMEDAFNWLNGLGPFPDNLIKSSLLIARDKLVMMRVRPIMIPDANYQDWVDSGKGIIDVGALAEQVEPIYCELVIGQYRPVASDDLDKYLYHRRRELGLRHPKRESRRASDAAWTREDAEVSRTIDFATKLGSDTEINGGYVQAFYSYVGSVAALNVATALPEQLNADISARVADVVEAYREHIETLESDAAAIFVTDVVMKRLR